MENVSNVYSYTHIYICVCVCIYISRKIHVLIYPDSMCYALSGEIRELFSGYGGHAPPEIFRKMVHFS